MSALAAVRTASNPAAPQRLVTAYQLGIAEGERRTLATVRAEEWADRDDVTPRASNVIAFRQRRRPLPMPAL